MHVKKGDKVKMLSGKDKGKTGTILRAMPKENRVVVEGVNIVKRHMKGSVGQTGHIAERPASVNASNVSKI